MNHYIVVINDKTLINVLATNVICEPSGGIRFYGDDSDAEKVIAFFPHCSYLFFFNSEYWGGNFSTFESCEKFIKERDCETCEEIDIEHLDHEAEDEINSADKEDDSGVDENSPEA